MCRECGKIFGHINFTDLQEHMINIHKVPAPLICDYCGKGFVRASRLKCHIRTHTGERPYSCSVCDKRFFRTDQLQIHSAYHSSERPFLCIECGKKFKKFLVKEKVRKEWIKVWKEADKKLKEKAKAAK